MDFFRNNIKLFFFAAAAVLVANASINLANQVAEQSYADEQATAAVNQAGFRCYRYAPEIYNPWAVNEAGRFNGIVNWGAGAGLVFSVRNGDSASCGGAGFQAKIDLPQGFRIEYTYFGSDDNQPYRFQNGPSDTILFSLQSPEIKRNWVGYRIVAEPTTKREGSFTVRFTLKNLSSGYYVQKLLTINVVDFDYSLNLFPQPAEIYAGGTAWTGIVTVDQIKGKPQRVWLDGYWYTGRAEGGITLELDHWGRGASCVVPCQFLYKIRTTASTPLGTYDYGFYSRSEGGSAHDVSGIANVSAQLPPVTATILANGVYDSLTATVGQRVKLEWTSTNAESCKLYKQLGDARSAKLTDQNLLPNGSKIVFFAEPVTYILTCVNKAGNGVVSRVRIEEAGRPPRQSEIVADIKANGSDGPITVRAGTPVGIRWNSRNATGCDIYYQTDFTEQGRGKPLLSPAGIGGEMKVLVNAAKVVFTERCRNDQNGDLGLDSVTVNVSGSIPWPGGIPIDGAEVIITEQPIIVGGEQEECPIWKTNCQR